MVNIGDVGVLLLECGLCIGCVQNSRFEKEESRLHSNGSRVEL